MHHQLKDKEISRLLKKNPQKAIKYLFDTYYDDLFRYAFKFVEQLETAEEIVQEIFIYLWEKRDSILVQSSFKSYLLRAVKNRAMNYFRTRYAKTPTIELENIELDTEDTFDNKNNLEELTKLTQAAINSLPPCCAMIFKLSRNFDMSYKEIAEHLNISIKTVGNQMTIALKKIRAYLDKRW